MEYVGVLPAPEDVIPPANIPLFGILAENTAEPGQCYFCFEEINGNELLAMTMHCCQQKAHCRCLQMWATHYIGTDIETVRCGYCRAPFPDKELCYLCLQNKITGQELKKTRCCQTTIHKKCTEILNEILANLTFDFSLECGELTFCGCVWHNL
ncbi:Hypothetical predicted protein [Paramuricea clavata]|uniref:Uncharacterized protein n=1 Tax=Paramuricea clavata TaxID=317549 RepID=A0A6S7GXU1_PARCT|nr:Hypothetical predicted protein [Paramuricea clavata]